MVSRHADGNEGARQWRERGIPLWTKGGWRKNGRQPPNPRFRWIAPQHF